jgi:hypothetical protein
MILMENAPHWKNKHYRGSSGKQWIRKYGNEAIILWAGLFFYGS